MSSPCVAEDQTRVLELVEEQKQLFIESELVRSLRSTELLLASVALSCVSSPSLYRGFPVTVKDNPKADTLTVLVDKPTVEDLVEEYARPKILTEEDVVRLYVGTGFASLLILHSLGPTRIPRMQKFASELSEPKGLYDRTMESPIFDDGIADETACAIATEGHAQTARVNALRLRAGMFIEVQPKPAEMREKVEVTFQDGLTEIFSGKPTYLETVGLFGVAEHEAKDIHSNTVETMMGLSFPMRKDEVKQFLRILS